MRRAFIALIGCVLLAAACGREAAPPGGSAGSRFPVTIDGAAGSVSVPRAPDRIVSLSPTATEILFAIGAGELVVAADEESNHPQDAPTTDLSLVEPNVEAVLGYEPDLVVSSGTPGLVDPLRAADVPLLVQPPAESFDDVYAQITDLGRATGSTDAAERLVTSMRSEIGRIARDAARDDRPTYYHELDDSYFTVTSDTFIGQVYARLGLRNIADAARGGTPYPQLSSEFIVDADPALIFLADVKCCGQSAATVAARPGWNRIAAVERGAVVELDDDIASRWGPRVVDFVRAVADAVEEHVERAS